MNTNWGKEIIVSMDWRVGERIGTVHLYGWRCPEFPGLLILQAFPHSFAVSGDTEEGKDLARRVEAVLSELMEPVTQKDELAEKLDFLTYYQPEQWFDARGVKVLEMCGFLAKLAEVQKEGPLAQPEMNTGEGREPWRVASQPESLGDAGSNPARTTLQKLAEKLTWITPVGNHEFKGFMVCNRVINHADGKNTRVDYLRVTGGWKKPFREAECLFPTFMEALRAAAAAKGVEMEITESGDD